MDRYTDPVQRNVPHRTRARWVAPTDQPFTDPAQLQRDVYTLSVAELVGVDARNRRQRVTRLTVEGGGTETLRQRINRERQELTDAITAIAAQLSRRTSQLTQLDAFPADDPCENGDTLRFEMTFPSSPDKAYSYAAIRIEGMFYVSGARSPQGVTWSEFVDWCGLGVRSIKLHRPSADGAAVAVTELLKYS